MERRTYAMLVSYDGGPYKGWHPHPALPTVAGVLTAALRRVGVGATPYGASRTDAGVHARAQVASFHSRGDLSPAALLAALETELPTTIQVRAVRHAPPSFHSHWSSIGKVYRYRISFAGEPRAWRLPTAKLDYRSLDTIRLAGALGMILAAPDVSALAGRGEHGPRARSIDRADVIDLGPRGVTIELQAAGFGKHLVRRLITSALGYSVGALSRTELRGLLTGELPQPMRADADGLVLHRVLYPPELDPFPDLERLAPMPDR